MISKLTVVLIIVTLVGTCTCPEDQPGRNLNRRKKFYNIMKRLLMNHAELAERGEKMYRREYYKEARRYFSKAIKKKPVAEYHARRGECFLKLRDVDKAVLDFKKAASLATNPTEYQILVCKTLIDSGKLEEARKEIPLLDHVEILKLGDKLCSERKFDDAIVVYSEAIAKYPHELCYRQRGLCHKENKNLDRAIKDLKEAVSRPVVYSDNQTRDLLIETLFASKNFQDAREEIHYLNLSDLLRLGDAYRSQMKFEEAICFYTEAITEYPHEKHYRLRGMCYIETGNLNAAISDYKDAVSLPPEQLDNLTRNLLIEALFDAKNVEEAIEETRFLDNHELKRLGDTFRAKGKFDAAIPVYTEVIAKYPHENNYRSRGLCYMAKNDLNTAILDFKQAISLPPQYSDNLTRNHLIEALLRSRNFDEAIAEMNHLDDTELAELGNSYCSQSKFEDALCFYRVAIRKNPSATELFRVRALCYTKMGALDEAFSDFEEVAKSYQHLPKHLKDGYGRVLLNVELFVLGRYEEARKQMLTLNVSQLMALGDELFEDQLLDRADECYSAAVYFCMNFTDGLKNKEPENAECYEKRAEFYRKRRLLHLAIPDYERAVHLDPSRVHCWIDLIELWLESRRHWTAKQILESQRTNFVNMTPENIVRIESARETIARIEEEEARRRREEEERRRREEEDRRRRREEEDRQATNNLLMTAAIVAIM